MAYSNPQSFITSMLTVVCTLGSEPHTYTIESDVSLYGSPEEEVTFTGTYGVYIGGYEVANGTISLDADNSTERIGHTVYCECSSGEQYVSVVVSGKIVGTWHDPYNYANQVGISMNAKSEGTTTIIVPAYEPVQVCDPEFSLTPEHNRVRINVTTPATVDISGVLTAADSYSLSYRLPQAFDYSGSFAESQDSKYNVYIWTTSASELQWISNGVVFTLAGEYPLYAECIGYDLNGEILFTKNIHLIATNETIHISSGTSPVCKMQIKTPLNTPLDFTTLQETFRSYWYTTSASGGYYSATIPAEGAYIDIPEYYDLTGETELYIETCEADFSGVEQVYFLSKNLVFSNYHKPLPTVVHLASRSEDYLTNTSNDSSGTSEDIQYNWSGWSANNQSPILRYKIILHGRFHSYNANSDVTFALDSSANSHLTWYEGLTSINASEERNGSLEYTTYIEAPNSTTDCYIKLPLSSKTVTVLTPSGDSHTITLQTGDIIWVEVVAESNYRNAHNEVVWLASSENSMSLENMLINDLVLWVHDEGKYIAGTVFVNTGTVEAPNWRPATGIYVNDNGNWTHSI